MKKRKFHVHIAMISFVKKLILMMIQNSYIKTQVKDPHHLMCLTTWGQRVNYMEGIKNRTKIVLESLINIQDLIKMLPMFRPLECTTCYRQQERFMRLVTVFLVFSYALATTAVGQTVNTVIDNGASSNRVDMIFIGDGWSIKSKPQNFLNFFSAKNNSYKKFFRKS